MKGKNNNNNNFLTSLYREFKLFFFFFFCFLRDATKLLVGPDKTKVKIINISSRSAFSAFSALPSYPKMAVPSHATANQQLPQVEASQ